MFVDSNGTKPKTSMPSVALGYGRFMQPDPIGYGDSLNWYNYTGSDPVNGSDPSGLADTRPCPGDDICRYASPPTCSELGNCGDILDRLGRDTPFVPGRDAVDEGPDIVVSATRPKPQKTKPGLISPFIKDSSCNNALRQNGSVLISGVNLSFIPLAGANVTNGKFEISQVGNPGHTYTGSWYSVGAGFGWDTGISYTMMGGYRNINSFVGQGYNFNWNLGVAAGSLNWGSGSLLPVGISVGASTPGKGASATASGTYIYSCRETG